MSYHNSDINDNEAKEIHRFRKNTIILSIDNQYHGNKL